MKRKSTEKEQEVFNYLNELRESGDTNMFGARSYIMSEFPEITSNEAKEMLMLWMANFNNEGNYIEIEDKNYTEVKIELDEENARTLHY